MRHEVLNRIYEQLQVPVGQLDFLKKLDDDEGDVLGRHLAQVVLHCRDEIYPDTHWEDD